MGKRFLESSGCRDREGNIYANRSSFVLEWLLREGIRRVFFTLREVARAQGVSVGLVQKVFRVLVAHGILETHGSQTKKCFGLKSARRLIDAWTDHYDVMKKCRFRAYRTAFSNKESLLDALRGSVAKDAAVLALHSAAQAHGLGNTNLQTVELYLTDPTCRLLVEEQLRLEPQERGYEVLLVEPYYKSLLDRSKDIEGLRVSPILLTFLDLYHFPLRGREQAEFLARKTNLEVDP